MSSCGDGEWRTPVHTYFMSAFPLPPALKFIHEGHRSGNARVPTHALAVVPQEILAALVHRNFHLAIGIAIRTSKTRAEPESGRHNHAHHNQVIMHTGQWVLCQPLLPHSPLWQWYLDFRRNAVRVRAVCRWPEYGRRVRRCITMSPVRCSASGIRGVRVPVEEAGVVDAGPR